MYSLYPCRFRALSRWFVLRACKRIPACFLHTRTCMVTHTRVSVLSLTRTRRPAGEDALSPEGATKKPKLDEEGADRAARGEAGPWLASQDKEVANPTPHSPPIWSRSLCSSRVLHVGRGRMGRCRA